jgi:hypothetical protein
VCNGNHDNVCMNIKVQAWALHTKSARNGTSAREKRIKIVLCAVDSVESQDLSVCTRKRAAQCSHSCFLFSCQYSHSCLLCFHAKEKGNQLTEERYAASLATKMGKRRRQ